MFYVLLYVSLCPLLFCNHLDGEERAGCFAKFVFLMSRDCCVALLAVPWVSLQFVIVAFPDHTHLLFLQLNQDKHFATNRFSQRAFYNLNHSFIKPPTQGAKSIIKRQFMPEDDAYDCTSSLLITFSHISSKVLLASLKNSIEMQQCHL